MITVDYLGVKGTGKTVKAAKADAARIVAGFMASAKSPLVYVYKGNVVIAWQTDVESASYTVVHHDTKDGRHFGTSSIPGDIDEAMAKGRWHLAQILEDAGCCADGYDRNAAQADIDRSRRFTAFYRQAEAEGYPDAHRAACEALSLGHLAEKAVYLKAS